MTVMFDVQGIFKQANEIIEGMAKGKVGYYWETLDSSPVLEVFVTGDVDGVLEKKHELMILLNAMEIKDGIEIDTERLRGNYYRLMVIMNLKYLTEKQVELIITLLKLYGEAEWKDEEYVKS